MKENIKFVLILAAVLLFFRFGFRLLVRLTQAVYMLVPMYVRVWYVSVPLTLLLVFLVRNEIVRHKRRREFGNLDPDKEIDAEADFEDKTADSDGTDDEC